MNTGCRTGWGWRGRIFLALPAPALMIGGLLAADVAGAQEHGSVIGVVVDEADLEPVEGALVALHDFTRRTRTDGQGRFELVDIPAGDVVIRIEEDAFISLVETLDITPLEATLVQFRLHRIGAMLDQIVGGTDRPTRGNRRGHSESEISASEADAQGIRTAADLLLRSMPGLTASRANGQSGAGLRIRLRGGEVPLHFGPAVDLSRRNPDRCRRPGSGNPGAGSDPGHIRQAHPHPARSRFRFALSQLCVGRNPRGNGYPEAGRLADPQYPTPIALHSHRWNGAAARHSRVNSSRNPRTRRPPR